MNATPESEAKKGATRLALMRKFKIEYPEADRIVMQEVGCRFPDGKVQK